MLRSSSHAFLRQAVMVLVLRQIALTAEALPVALPVSSFFGSPGALSPVPQNTAQYLLDLEGKYLHYFGDQQIFLVALSPALKQHLQSVTSSGRPVMYGVDHLAGGVCDWSRVPGWTSSDSGADAEHIFYGREIRDAPNTLYGNAIHLSLGPHEDPEGWTSQEMAENHNFWKAIAQDGQSVGVADGAARHFRTNIATELGGTFKQRWGSGVTTKAHRFALQMYTAESQGEANNPGGRFFEMFAQGMPPTRQVVFVEAEDGCKGTPTPVPQQTSLLL